MRIKLKTALLTICASIFCALLSAPSFALTLTELQQNIKKTSDEDLKIAETKLAEARAAQETKSAIATAAMGFGGMMLAEGLVQNKAEEAGAETLKAFQDTWICGVSTGGENGNLNWSGKTIKAGEVGTTPEIPQEVINLAAQSKNIKNQINILKGDLDMVLTDEEKKEFAATGLYGASNETNAKLDSIKTNGGANKIAAGAGLTVGGGALALGSDYTTAIGAGGLTGGITGLAIGANTTGSVAATGVGALATGVSVLGSGDKTITNLIK
jgi:hypothetical protein